MSIANLDKTPISHVHPINGRLIIRRDAAPEKTDAGLHIPNQAKEVPCTGTVVAGSTLSVPANSRVLFGPYSGAAIVVGGEPYLLMKDDEVLAVISPTPPARFLGGSERGPAPSPAKDDFRKILRAEPDSIIGGVG